jgi:phosphatidylglycerol---prolipoprotein diacylglyceryl transferase
VNLQIYGILIASALALGTWLCTREEKRLGLPKDTGLDIVLYALTPAVIMARLYYVAFTWESFKDDPILILYFWQGGLAIYGAVIGGALGVWCLSRRKKIRFATLADMVVAPLLLGQAIGRWGNYFNGEAYGYTVINPSFQFFPFAVLISGSWHLATFFYESMWNLLGFLFLYFNRDRFQRQGRRGHVLLWYFLWYGLGRMCIEGLRTDSLMAGPIRVSQLLSLLLCAAAVVKIMLDFKMEAAFLVFPLFALLLTFLLPGWIGIGLSCVVLISAAPLLYKRYPAQGSILP